MGLKVCDACNGEVNIVSPACDDWAAMVGFWVADLVVVVCFEVVDEVVSYLGECEFLWCDGFSNEAVLDAGPVSAGGTVRI